MNAERKLLCARLLTRSGDHAWDFAVPLALLQAFPGHLQVAAFFYLLTKLLQLFLTPACGRWLDRRSLTASIRTGVFLQVTAVLIGGSLFFQLDTSAHTHAGVWSMPTLGFFVAFVLVNTAASLGALMTEIAVGNDLVLSVVPEDRLTVFNSWLRRWDLASEVLSPVLVGVLFAWNLAGVHLSGFYFVVVWNLVSFFPEYLLLQNVVSTTLPKNRSVNANTVSTSAGSFWSSMKVWKSFRWRQEPLALLFLSSSCLWLSALSPHGVLLTGYLKDEMRLPELQIGIFRALGAVFGLLSTLSFPWWVKKRGLVAASKWHVGWQLAVLLAGAMVFWQRDTVSIYWFLFLVLCSRVGLYGFMNGEFELRQRLIPADQRGRVNSAGVFLNTLATLILFGMGSALPSTSDFKALVFFSVIMVGMSFWLFHRWVARILPVCETFGQNETSR